ncbi:MAG: serine/threonine-protein phosphatase, partial [Planctomycetota bacterium]
RSAGIGCGDYFDFLSLPGRRVGVVVGDVSGHGMPAAVRMIEARAHLRALCRSETDPGRLLTELNRFMLEDAAYGDHGAEQFVTMFLAVLEPDGRTAHYAGAGHDAYLIGNDGEERHLKSTGLPLGIDDQPIDTAGPIALAPGDILLLATDGIEESEDPAGTFFGRHRLLETVRTHRKLRPQRLVERICTAVEAFRSEAPQRDDVTLLVVRPRH